MITDVNAYFGTWPLWPLRESEPEAMLSAMDRCGIERAYVCSLKAVFSDPETGNAEAGALAKRFKGRFYPAFSYSPYGPGRERFREQAGAFEKRLVKLLPVPQGYEPLEEPYIGELLDWCGASGVPVAIPHRLMMSWRLPRYEIQKVGALAARHPRTSFILTSVNYVLELQSALDVMRRNPNVYLETSAMMALHELEQVAAEIGARRLLHGTAMPLQMPEIGPLRVRSAELPEADKERILFRNAEELGL